MLTQRFISKIVWHGPARILNKMSATFTGKSNIEMISRSSDYTRATIPTLQHVRDPVIYVLKMSISVVAKSFKFAGNHRHHYPTTLNAESWHYSYLIAEVPRKSSETSPACPWCNLKLTAIKLQNDINIQAACLKLRWDQGMTEIQAICKLNQFDITELLINWARIYLKQHPTS